MDKDELIAALSASIQDLQKGIDRHCCLVASILDEGLEESELRPLMQMCPSKLREGLLKNAIKDAIESLEQSRKAFKSKQLEALRKRLTQVLIDAD